MCILWGLTCQLNSSTRQGSGWRTPQVRFLGKLWMSQEIYVANYVYHCKVILDSSYCGHGLLKG